MKLRVECPADPNYHYILLKFDGVFNESLQEVGEFYSPFIEYIVVSIESSQVSLTERKICF